MYFKELLENDLILMIWLVPGVMREDADQHVSECRLGEESGFNISTNVVRREKIANKEKV